jgi:hypothetical protein
MKISSALLLFAAFAIDPSPRCSGTAGRSGVFEGLLGSLPFASNRSITASDHARVLDPMGVGSGKSPADTQRHNVVR